MEFRKLTSNELLKLTDKLLIEIERRKKITKEEFIKKGYIKKEERLTYENIDTTDLEEDLLLVLYNYHTNVNYKLKYTNKEKVEKVCLAAMCQFIKGEHHIRAYTKDYENLTKAKVDGRMYNILENAFKKENILPKNWDKMKGFRYKDTLINETGIPKHLANELIELFKLYWKNLKHFEFEYVFENIDVILRRSYIWDTKELEKIKECHKILSEYPQKVNKVIKQLCDVCTLLEEGNYYEEDLSKDSVVNAINKVLKFDIFRILPRKDSLKSLYIQILSKVSVQKFRNILNNAPMGTRIITPNKKEISPRQYKDIQLGIHNINYPNYRIYTVLPHTSLSINKLLDFNKDKFTKINETHIGYRSNKRFNVKLGKSKIEESYPLYNNYILKGYYWYGKISNGIPIIINNTVYEPDKFVDYTPVFKYDYNDISDTYSYNLLLNNFKIYLKPYANEKIIIKCNYSEEIKNILIDKDGYIENKKIVFNINKQIEQKPISIKIYHYSNGHEDILYEEDIKNIDDINLYIKNLKKNNYSKTNFEYEIKEKSWKFSKNTIFHLEEHINIRNRVITNIKDAGKKVEVLSNYDNKYNQFLLEDITQKEGNKIYLCHNKLRDKVKVDKDSSAKIKLTFINNYERIFDAEIVTLSSIDIKLDSDIYVEGDFVKIEARYKDEISSNESKIETIKIKDKIVSRFIPISIYIKELDSYYTQYIKPNILGYIIRDKYSFDTLDIDSIHYDNIDRYEIEIQSDIDKKIEVLVNSKKIDINSNIIDLSSYKEYFKLDKNNITISQLGKKVEFTVLRDVKNNIFDRLNKDLKWYEIDEIYTKEDLKEDLNFLARALKNL
ncbi:hypothetical protein [Romboutsia timonensis]|uniref:hypothetical protein n=1 Tax=Romboutsia timonensis TaxID=1776391 RepID=UPI0008D9AEC6|nr:hypothetical protein [Romboutsia timonensis]